MSFFTWGDGGVQMTPERIAAERKVAQAMAERGMDFSPVQHWTQGAARVAQALVGAQETRGLHEAEKANAAADKDWLKGLAPGATPAVPAVVTPAAPVGDGAMALSQAGQPLTDVDGGIMPPGSVPAGNPSYRSAIAAIETGGQKNPYATIGPANSKGQRPIGKYQVMDFNVGPWTEQHLGRRMTPAEFAADPVAQDAVFDKQFGTYVKQHGNPQDAASLWFSGKPLAGNNRSDVLGTTVPSYVQKFTKNLGRQAPAVAPTAVAAAEDPAALPPNAMPTQGYAIPGQSAPIPAQAAPAVGPGGMPAIPLPALLAKVNDPYASEGVKKIAGMLLQHQLQGDQVTHVDLGDKVGIMDKRGNLIRSIPKGEPNKGASFVDGPIDPTTGQPTKVWVDPKDKSVTPYVPPSNPSAAPAAIPPPPPGVRPKDWYEAQSKQTAQAALSLPATIAKAQESLDLITALEKHGGRGTATGLSSVIDPRNYVPGTDAKDFQIKQRQLQGKAFLEAFESLKGGGAITEVEGKKATDAIASLDTSQSDKAYLQSIRELRVIVKNGIERAKQKADPTYKPQLETMPTDEKPTGKTKSGVTWSVE